MSEYQVSDWKDVANSYFDKCIALIILFLMFFFIVYPNVESKALRSIDRTIEVLEYIPEEMERIEQPPDIVRPIINIEIVDDPDDQNDPDLIEIVTIDVTIRPPDITPPPDPGRTPKVVFYEDPPGIIKRVPPVYPEFARRTGIQGEVVLEVEVLIDGSIGAIEVLKSLSPGPGGLDEAAINAMRQWEFQPARALGNPVACWIRQSINFTLN